MQTDEAESRTALARRIKEVSSLEGEFLLRSGQVSQRYFDKYRFEGDPDILRQLARLMASLLPKNTEIVAGLALGGVPLATAISLETGLPAAFIRKEAKPYGTCRAIEGQDISGRSVTFTDDVITTGGAVADAYRLSDKEGPIVETVVCAIWRGSGKPGIAALPELTVSPVFTQADLQ